MPKWGLWFRLSTHHVLVAYIGDQAKFVFGFDNQTNRLILWRAMNLPQYAAKTKITPTDFAALLKAKTGLEVTGPAVHWWFIGERKPSPKKMAAIEKATGGVVTRHHMRPDIFGPPKRRKAAA